MAKAKKAPPVDYVAKATALNRDDLKALWALIKNGDPTPDWAAGKAFEHLILRAFELDGADIVWPFGVSLHDEQVEQIDGMVTVEHLKCLVEAKHYATAVNVEPIAKLRNQLLRRPAGVIGLVFSVNGFTSPATILATYAAPQAFLLWSGSEIGALLESGSFTDALKVKFHRLVQDGIPDFVTTIGV